MTAVATKPRASKEAAPAKPEPTEVEALMMRAAEVIADVLLHVTGGPSGGGSPGYDEACGADNAICAIAHWKDPDYQLSPTDTLQGLLDAARGSLIAAHGKVCSGMHQHRGWGLSHAALLETAFQRTQQLMDAYNGLPGTLDDLRKLATANGADLFGEPRRAHVSHDQAAAPAASVDEDTPVELAWWRASEAIGILELTDNSDAVFGARVLLEQATEIIKEQAPDGEDTRRCEQASLLLCYVIGILQADAADRTDHAQNGALTLVQLAKDHLDSHWDKVPRHA